MRDGMQLQRIAVMTNEHATESVARDQDSFYGPEHADADMRRAIWQDHESGHHSPVDGLVGPHSGCVLCSRLGITDADAETRELA